MCVMVIMFVCVFKQKTAYEMRISDWSSDVCSSDLRGARRKAGARAALPARLCAVAGSLWRGTGAAAPDADGADQHRAAPCLGSGSASGRRVHHHPRRLRSEEHTSELQSLMRISYAVFCLKKKTMTTKHQQEAHTINT